MFWAWDYAQTVWLPNSMCRHAEMGVNCQVCAAAAREPDCTSLLHRVRCALVATDYRLTSARCFRVTLGLARRRLTCRTGARRLVATALAGVWGVGGLPVSAADPGASQLWLAGPVRAADKVGRRQSLATTRQAASATDREYSHDAVFWLRPLVARRSQPRVQLQAMGLST